VIGRNVWKGLSSFTRRLQDASHRELSQGQAETGELGSQ
jgi:hypothetical protein